jgi:ubiquinone/menaquinone biosynthesis C-methylase UbiE
MNINIIVFVFIFIVILAVFIAWHQGVDVVPFDALRHLRMYIGGSEGNENAPAASDAKKIKDARKVIVVDAREQDIIEYIDPATDREEKYYTNSRYYILPESDNQVMQVYKRGKANDRARLFILLCPDGNIYNFIKYIKMRDSDVYRSVKLGAETDLEARGRAQALEFHRALIRGDTKRPTSYLDFGCGDGIFTRWLAEFSGLSECHCVDISAANDAPGMPHRAIVGPDDTKLPFPDGKFDLVTALMSLHHVKHLDEIAAEIARVTMSGGTIFYKEHDCWNAMDAMLVDIEHSLYGAHADYGHALHYKNYHGWQKLFGPWFEFIAGGYYHTNIHNDTKPTRAFYGILRRK